MVMPPCCKRLPVYHVIALIAGRRGRPILA
jgi:hypothetical protein